MKLIFWNKYLLQSLNSSCSVFMKILNIMRLLIYLGVLGIQPINQEHLRHSLTKEIARKCICKTSIIFTHFLAQVRLKTGAKLTPFTKVSQGSRYLCLKQGIHSGPKILISWSRTTLICCSSCQKDLWGPWYQQLLHSPALQPHFTPHAFLL